MRKFLSSCKTLLILMLLPTYMWAQEEKTIAFNRNKISTAITHTHVPAGVNESGDKYWLTLASWAFDYDYRINRAWGIGLHTDLVIQNFSYKDGEGAIKKREKPVSLVLVGTRKLGEHLTVLAGGGIELSKSEETLSLLRLGADYGWELPKDWEVSISIMTDFKVEAYNAFVLGLAIGKTF